MALWQFELNLIPKKVFVKDDGSFPLQLSEDELDSISGWNDAELSLEASTLIERFLPKNPSRSQNHVLWGKEDLSCIHIFYDNGLQTSVWIRLDLRDFNKNLIDLVVDLSKLMDAIGINDNGELFPVSKNSLKEQVLKSNAFKFVSDPRGFFDTH